MKFHSYMLLMVTTLLFLSGCSNILFDESPESSSKLTQSLSFDIPVDTSIAPFNLGAAAKVVATKNDYNLGEIYLDFQNGNLQGGLDNLVVQDDIELTLFLFDSLGGIIFTGETSISLKVGESFTQDIEFTSIDSDIVLPGTIHTIAQTFDPLLLHLPLQGHTGDNSIYHWSIENYGIFFESYGVYFDGNSYLRCQQAPELNPQNTSFTLSFWLRTNMHRSMLFNQKSGDFSSTDPGWNVTIEDGYGPMGEPNYYRQGVSLSFADGNGSYQRIITDDGKTFDNQWHHITIVIDRQNNQANLYVDGVHHNGTPIDYIGNFSNSEALQIGTGGGMANYVGALYNVQLLAYPMSDNEVNQTYTDDPIQGMLGFNLSSNYFECVDSLGNKTYMQIHQEDMTAWRDENGSSSGWWWYNGNELQIEYYDGWKERFYPEGDHYIKQSYAPSVEWHETPTKSYSVYGMGYIPYHDSILGTWHYINQTAIDDTLTFDNTGYVSRKSDNRGGDWYLYHNGARIKWHDGQVAKLTNNASIYQYEEYEYGHDWYGMIMYSTTISR